MNAHLRANLWLLGLTIVLCSVIYPLVLWGIGQTVFTEKAEGSMITGAKGEVIGSHLIAQPFTTDEYFQPRPSAASYKGEASGGTNWAASNYLLRDRVARQLGPVVKYASGPKKGQLAAPDIEAWFQKDQYAGKPGIVAQWANAHSTVAQNWVKADEMNGNYVTAWQKTHDVEVAQWKTANPDNTDPKPEDLAVPFFTSFSKSYPGTFPSAVEHKSPDGRTEKTVEPVKAGTDIQSVFFDMWTHEHPDADLEKVPGDMVTASFSGLDPHITLDNANWQLDRVAAAWAKRTGADPANTRGEIEQLLREKTFAPLGGLVGESLVNVLEMNITLQGRYQKSAGGTVF
ncbi:MAG: potassium-transporting ATPase subunit C [Candidatus Hydrogenedentes bacterium]|nr:potassium-transporting ATPase subunit C [Candidatus Hydrogenedentota bacterium]